MCLFLEFTHLSITCIEAVPEMARAPGSITYTAVAAAGVVCPIYIVFALLKVYKPPIY